MRDKLGENLRQRLWNEHQSNGGTAPRVPPSGMEDDRVEEPRPLASKLMQWVGGLVSLLLVLGVVYWVFELGRRDANEVPVIQAMGGAARVAPEDPGGRVVDNQGLQVNEVLAGNETAPVEPETRLAPPAQRVAPEDAATIPPPEILTPVQPSDTTSVPPAPQPAGQLSVLPSSLPEADPNMRRPVRRVSAPPLSPNAELLSEAIASAISEVVSEETSESPALPAPEATPPEAQAEPDTPPPAADPTGLNGERMIQLGVYDDEPSAIADWELLQADNQDLMGNLTRFVERREAGGRVFYRLRARGFANMNEATDMCTALLAREVQCIAVTAR